MSTNRTNIQAKFCFPMYPAGEGGKLHRWSPTCKPWFLYWVKESEIWDYTITKHKVTTAQKRCRSPVRNWLLLQPRFKQTIKNKTNNNNKNGGWGWGEKEKLHTHSQKEPLAKCRLGLKKESNINYPTCIPLFVNLSIHQHVCTCGAENTHHIL